MNIKSFRFLSLLAWYVPVVYSQHYTGLTINNSLELNDGDTIESSVVADQGKLTLNGSSQSDRITVSDGGAFEILTHASDSGSTIQNGGIQSVNGTATNTKVYGMQHVKSDGATDNTRLYGTGAQHIQGRVNKSRAYDNGTINVYKNGHATSSYLNNTATMNILDGGIAESAYVYDNAIINVDFGGIVSDINLYDNATLNVKGGGNSSDIYAFNQSTVNVDQNSTVNNSNVYDYSIQNVKKGASAFGTGMMGNSILNVIGGSVTDSFLDEDSTLNVVSGGTAVDSKLYGNSIMNVDSGGIAMDTIAFSGNVTINVGKDGRVQNTRVGRNSIININNDGLAIDTTLTNDSKLNLNGGTVDGLSLTNASLNATAGEIKGDVDIQSGGITLVNTVKSSQADVIVRKYGRLLLAKNNAPLSYSINSLNLDNGAVSFYDNKPNSFKGSNTLTLGSLIGSGNIYMHTHLASNENDFLNVTGSASGSFSIFVEDTGASPSIPQQHLLVKTASGDANFTLGNQGGVVDLGTFQYALKEETKGSWVLTSDITTKPEPQPDPKPQQKPEITPEQKPELKPDLKPQLAPVPGKRRITPATAGVLNMAAANPLVFDAELESVRERLDSNAAFYRDGAAWGTSYSTRKNASTSAGAGFEQTLTGITLGVDRTFPLENSVVTSGLFFSYSHANLDFDRGGKGNIDSYALGAYAGWQHNNGFYVDSIVKFNRFENDVQGRMTGGGAANGDYNAYGAGAHLESGIRLAHDDLSVTPYTALTGFATDSNKYRLSNSMHADVDNTYIMRAEAGLKADYRMRLDNGVEIQPWLKTSVRQEFADDNRVKVNNDGKFVNDQSGTRGVYQAGLRAKFTNVLSGQLSASYGNGAGVEEPWHAAAGVSWSF